MFQSFKRVLPRLMQGLGDQGVLSVTNLVASLLLARWLGLEGFGVYTLGFTGLILAQSLIVSLWIDPLVYLGASFAGNARARYLGALTIFSLASLCGLGIVAVAIGFWAGVGEFVASTTLAAMAGSIQILFRRNFYALKKVEKAFFSSVVYSIIFLGAIWWIASVELLTQSVVFLAMAFASTAAIIVCLILDSNCCPRWPSARMRQFVFHRHWRVARWLLGQTLAHWASVYGVYPLVGATLGPAASGVLRIVELLYRPMTQIGAVVCHILMRDVVMLYRQDERVRSMAVVFQLSVAFAVCAIVYSLFVSFFGGRLVYVLFDEKPVVSFLLLFVMGINVILDSAKQPLGLALLAQKITAPIFVARLLALAGFAISVFVMLPIYGLVGVVTAMAIASFIALLLFLGILVKVR